MVKVIFSLCVILLSLNSYALTTVTASVDKNPVVVNESLILTVVADDNIDNDALDTSALLRDFIVGRTSVSTQTSIMNFNATRTTTWTTVLIPRKAGEFIIPSFNIDGETSQPIKVKAVAVSDLPASQQQALFITTEASATDIYVQQQITLKVKLHFATQLKRGSLNEPVLAGANILQIGKDKESEDIINGKRYRIIERTYAISPQQSGNVVLKSPVFSGEIILPSSGRSNFLSFSDTKPVSVIGDDIPLTVKAIPEQVSGTWLPSELLALHQEWQPEPSQFKVGEPITRTVTLTAAGLSEAQLPKLVMTVPKGLKVYPDQDELHTGLNNERLVSQKVVNFAIVASQPGEYQLPEITIPWWNTVTNKAEVAKISGQTITILPNPDIIQTPDATTPAIENVATAPLTPVTQTVVVQQSSLWPWIFLPLWLLTLLAWFISAKRPFSKTTKKLTNTSGANNAYLELMAACKTNNGEAALALLSPWAQSQANNTADKASLTSLDGLHQYFNDQTLTSAIIELQQSYYGKVTKQWQGGALLSAIQRLNQKSSSPSNNDNTSINP